MDRCRQPAAVQGVPGRARRDDHPLRRPHGHRRVGAGAAQRGRGRRVDRGGAARHGRADPGRHPAPGRLGRQAASRARRTGTKHGRAQRRCRRGAVHEPDPAQLLLHRRADDRGRRCRGHRRADAHARRGVRQHRRRGRGPGRGQGDGGRRPRGARGGHHGDRVAGRRWRAPDRRGPRVRARTQRRGRHLRGQLRCPQGGRGVSGRSGRKGLRGRWACGQHPHGHARGPGGG